MLLQKIIGMNWMGSFFTHDYYELFVREMKICPGSWNEGCYVTDFLEL
jgi:hypothetical protein